MRLLAQITGFVTVASIVGLLSGCTISSPFKGPGYKSGSVIVETENEMVVVGLTYIQTGTDAGKNKIFWSHVSNVHDNLGEHEGLIGHAIRRETIGNQGWTMSVWQDQQSLNRFVESDLHQTAIQQGSQHL